MIERIDKFLGKSVAYYKLNTETLHREDGPAHIYFNNENKEIYREWFKDGLAHRENGPAYVNCIHHTKEWWYNGVRHRLDGPAIESSDGTSYWHYQGQKIDCKSQEEFERIIKLKAFW